MATRRRIGVSAASTEAARRQLMQPVPCWERVSVTPDVAPPGSTLKVWKWVKTDKIQHFSDDEGGVDDPLAPLPDEPEVVEGDEEMELEETQAAAAKTTIEGTPLIIDEPPSKPASPKPQLKMTLPSADDGVNGDAETVGLDASLKPMVDTSLHDMDEKNTVVVPDVGADLDMSALGPDGLGLEGTGLSQMDVSDGLVGGPLLDQTDDPFGPGVA
ncbi:hypothetical protein AGABI1DRAFT_110745 [Agaricus bisporus var. burnettii JB137-S8]|uniref:Uncharacterized protein n=1 Tax=Agaricus bisporus var. burnettii (strain JB137-S8 / ATCC MYA-4627 / FGSC 10392) TaxID=597362 RepID=K5X8E3_AGABU|nr:uncharacterized protein AGABI1DRAFT_110745 [Agaricus bisporus var. burnettii JB137-S8]EKM84181.1 hypothetical protein AGABI1DRAFT_110745 [Agaricus bisporus var. burnettii JB137-S8]